MLVPSLASSTLEFEQKSKVFAELFGVGGNIFTKTKNLEGLNKFFDIRLVVI